MRFFIDFEPVGRRGDCPAEQSLLDCARSLNVDLLSICGGIGSCERCKVQVMEGQVSKPTLDEIAILSHAELAQGYRLACQSYPLSDVKLHVPPDSLSAPQRTQVEGLEVSVAPQPTVVGIEVSLQPPSLESPQADEDNLWSAILAQQPQDQAALVQQAGTSDLHVLRELSEQLRKPSGLASDSAAASKSSQAWQISAAMRIDEQSSRSEIVALGAPGSTWLGLAVDIGTTKIAGYLIDLQSGRVLASHGMMNPQISYGEDVIARIAAAGRSASQAEKLQTLLVDALNQLAGELCQQAQANPRQIVDAVVVGNTAIHHLFLRLPLKQLGLSPYVPAVRSALDIKGRDLGLQFSPGAYLHLLPNIAGYVGADHVAMLLATGMLDAPERTLAIDIGTNTEICLKHAGRLVSVSCASGPAFEGAHIRFGMRAAPGAIEHVRLQGETLSYQTIGGAPPVGICGSGLLDIVAQLLLNGIVDRGGRMQPEASSRLHRNENGPEFVLVSKAEREGQPAITLSQQDVRELQLAKGAIRLGIQALLQEVGLTEPDIQRVVIAGAFGTFIDVASAITIGMLPALPLERYQQVGNAAGAGARLALISRSQRRLAQELARQVGYVELASLPGFQRKFAQATYLENVAWQG
jgi:uncharacterized 2Fe-2S/4Fe-4S cluster protein (DUF4445 family)